MRFIIIQIGSDSMAVMSDIMAGPVHDIRIQSLGPEQRFASASASYPQIAFPSFRRSWMKVKTLLLTLYTELNNRSYSGSISGPTFMHQEMS